MTLQHHAKFENDPMSGLGDTAWDGRTDRRTDGRTDGHTWVIPRFHFCQRHEVE